MTHDQQHLWLMQRATVSLENARRATNPAVVAVHMELHKRYLEQAAEVSGYWPRPHIV